MNLGTDESGAWASGTGVGVASHNQEVLSRSFNSCGRDLTIHDRNAAVGFMAVTAEGRIAAILPGNWEAPFTKGAHFCVKLCGDSRCIGASRNLRISWPPKLPAAAKAQIEQSLRGFVRGGLDSLTMGEEKGEEKDFNPAKVQKIESMQRLFFDSGSRWRATTISEAQFAPSREQAQPEIHLPVAAMGGLHFCHNAKDYFFQILAGEDFRNAYPKARVDKAIPFLLVNCSLPPERFKGLRVDQKVLLSHLNPDVHRLGLPPNLPPLGSLTLTKSDTPGGYYLKVTAGHETAPPLSVLHR